jgi:hypothetical protein
LRALAFLRRILLDGAEKEANCFATGYFHSGVDSASSFFRGNTARGFEGRSQASEQPEGGDEVVNFRNFDRGVDSFSGRMTAVGDQRGNEAGKNGIDLALGLRVDGDSFHTLLPQLYRPPGKGFLFVRLP